LRVARIKQGKRRVANQDARIAQLSGIDAIAVGRSRTRP
jgi:hypothetical protein